MATQLAGGEATNYRTTDHTVEIQTLRDRAREMRENGVETPSAYTVIRASHLAVIYGLLADLLQSHDDTGISLDDWSNARMAVETALGAPILPNGV
jgi:hypothetical protein